MKCKILTYAVLLASLIVCAVTVQRHHLVTTVAAQTSVDRSAAVPTFQVDPSWPKVPAKWKLGDASSIGIDAADHVWVLHRPRTLPADQLSKAAPPVIVFDGAGNYIQSWGGPGSGYEWPEREHGIHIDNKGFVWIGGNNCPARGLPGLKAVGDDQLLKFTQAGKIVMQIGHSSESTGNADTRNLHQPADAVVYRKTNELFVADGYGNHRIIVFDADTGQYKRMWSAYGNAPVDLPPTPPMTAEQAREHNETRPLATQFDPKDPGPQQFVSPVHGVKVSNDQLVYVADRGGKRVQVFTTDGKYLTQVWIDRWCLAVG